MNIATKISSDWSTPSRLSKEDNRCNENSNVERQTVSFSTLLKFCCALAVVALGGALSSASAQEGKAYYAGKTVRMIVGSGTGGGYDIFSRMIAPYLAKELGTTVIVENQPGPAG